MQSIIIPSPVSDQLKDDIPVVQILWYQNLCCLACMLSVIMDREILDCKHTSSCFPVLTLDQNQNPGLVLVRQTDENGCYVMRVGNLLGYGHGIP